MKLINYGKKIGRIIEKKYDTEYNVVESRFTKAVFVRFHDIDLQIMLQKVKGSIDVRIKGEDADNWGEVEHYTTVPRAKNKHLDDLIFDIEAVIKGREKFKLPEKEDS